MLYVQEGSSPSHPPRSPTATGLGGEATWTNKTCSVDRRSRSATYPGSPPHPSLLPSSLPPLSSPGALASAFYIHAVLTLPASWDAHFASVSLSGGVTSPPAACTVFSEGASLSTVLTTGSSSRTLREPALSQEDHVHTPQPDIPVFLHLSLISICFWMSPVG